MQYDRSFRFVDDDFNQRLLNKLRQGNFDYQFGTGEVIEYRSSDEEQFEDMLSEVRSEVFSEWQVVSFPRHWVEQYRDALKERGIESVEEFNNGETEFLLPADCDPHSWDIESPNSAPTPL